MKEPRMPEVARSSREVRVAAVPDGLPEPADLTVAETPVPVPGPDDVLVRNRFCSVFAALRTLLGGGVAGAPFPGLSPGDTLFGPAVGEVITAPAGSGLRPGDLVGHMLGWRDYAVLPAAQCAPVDSALPDPVAHLAQGMTAYGALTRAARVRAGDTVFVSGGAGSVGSMAGQIARLLGAGRVIGSTGSSWKAQQMISGLGYDAVVVRGAAPVTDQLTAAAPDGIDVLLDNTGGEELQGGKVTPAFRVLEVFRPAYRKGPVLVGNVLSTEIKVGTRLTSATDPALVLEVIAIDLPTAKSQAERKLAIVVRPDPGDALQPGLTLNAAIQDS
jgi:NADPH-dependent curcumin reductase CurA